MPNRKLTTLVCLLILFLDTPLAHATTIIAIITAQGIVIGSDRKATQKSADSTPIGTRIQDHKIVLVADNRILVASSGLTSGPGYDFPTWIDGISKDLPKNISVKDFVALLERKSAAEFKDFDYQVLQAGLLTPSPMELCKPFIQYLVLGYDDAHPWLYLVQFYIDWDRGHLLGPKSSVLHPTERNKADVGLYPIGQIMAIVDIANRDSYAHKQAILHSPDALTQFLANGNVSKAQAVALITTLLGVEEEVNPSEVSGLGRVFYLPKSGRGSEIREGQSPLGKTKASGTKHSK